MAYAKQTMKKKTYSKTKANPTKATRKRRKKK